jgi:DNA-binding LytR/AlgR family response regulator
VSNALRPCATIAEDEPVLARTLVRLLREAWPELRIAAVASDGLQATTMALEHTPDVLFLDIKMPGRTGLEVAEAVTDEWPDGKPLPLIVFITAYDQFAVEAFERAAVDYLLKPATTERLAITIARLRQRLGARAAVTPSDDRRAAMVRQLQAIDPGPDAPRERIKVIRAGVGNTVRMIPVTDVLCLEATEKYVNVITAGGEALVRMSLRELASRIDGVEFTQVHRSMMVNTASIVSATRDENAHFSLTLRGLQRPVKVSRAFSHMFRAM